GVMAPRESEQRVEAARRFNRFYTRKIGVLREGAYQSPFSLTEVRVLYELAHRDKPTATALGRALGLDAGYLSRILRGFERRGPVYAQEYGYNEQFEALVAEIVAQFVQRYDAQRERCWIAEQDGDVVGCVFLVGRSKSVAQLRLLLVEPEARGSGLGTRLVDECVRFARAAGYRKIMLWTQSELRAARRLYQAAGFRVVGKEKNHSFGKDLVSETWELEL